MDKRIVGGIVVLILVLIFIVYRRKTSDYVNPPMQISMVDLKEFSYLSNVQKETYLNFLNSASSNLIQSASMNNYNTYSTILSAIMPASFLPPVGRQEVPPPSSSVQEPTTQANK